MFDPHATLCNVRTKSAFTRRRLNRARVTFPTHALATHEPSSRRFARRDTSLLRSNRGRRLGLEAAGAFVVGQVPTLAKAEAMLGEDAAIDCAVLDINLAGDTVFALADRLGKAGVPFVFLSRYTKGSIPSRLAKTPLLEKPVDMAALGMALEKASGRRRIWRDQG